MKKLLVALLSIAAIAGLLVLNTGCKTVVTDKGDGTFVTNKVVNAAAIIPVINGVVPVAVQIAVNKDTNSVPYLRAASVVLDALVSSGNYNPADVSAALSSLKANTPEAQLAVSAGLAIYKAFAADAVTAKLESSQSLAVLKAFSEALKQGLAYSVTPTVGNVVQVKVK